MSIAETIWLEDNKRSSPNRKPLRRPRSWRSRSVDYGHPLRSFYLSNHSTLQQGNSKADNQKTAMAGLKMSCGVCKSLMPDPKTYKQVEGRFFFLLRNDSIFIICDLKQVQQWDLCFRSLASAALQGFAKEGGDVERSLDQTIWMIFLLFQHFENKHPKSPLPAEIQGV